MTISKFSSLTLGLLLAFSPALGELSAPRRAFAQTAPAPLPSLPSGAQIKIDGSEGLQVITETLKGGFEKQYPGATVNSAQTTTDEALAELEGGQIDLAAIGRPLTEEEKARGLQQAPISRHKIAIIVSPQNPVADITLEQFAQIFRGEIKNWSEVGGEAGEILVVDRPETSDTRRSFGTYPIFQSAPLKTGDNAEVVTEDNTDMVVQKLGKNGISYAIIDQVKDRQDVKIVPMNKVLPSDPRYPFSQPLAYAFKGPNPSPQVKAFLCFANTTDYAAEEKVVSPEFCN